jgi:pyruvate/2-oxoglutarate dehydrogenase complex dihydrolipoamide acyltransferase (E2) component
MPKLSMTMESGEVVSWLKGEGDEVRAGEALCEVGSDKTSMEVESPVDGTLVRIVAAPEDVVAVGEPLAYLSTASEGLLDDLF